MTVQFSKRRLLQVAPSIAAGAAMLAPVSSTRVVAAPQHASPSSTVIHLGAVNTPDYSGLLDMLIGEFHAQTGYEVHVTSGEDVYDHARDGAYDLVISHYGKEEVEPFVLEGLGLWPRTVFANQIALIGPPGDPAQIRGMADVVAAFQRIVERQAGWVVNALPGLSYLEAILWHGVGMPEKGAWYVDTGLRGERAIAEAARRGAYVMWGAFPFLRLLEERALALEPLVLSDSLLQRVMVTVVVNPERFPEANVEGALTFQQYLLSPAVQARIRTLRIGGLDTPLWWPAARHNNPAFLLSGLS